jgi:hypothetical protein
MFSLVGAQAATKRSMDEIKDIVLERATHTTVPVYGLTPYQAKVLQAKRRKRREEKEEAFRKKTIAANTQPGEGPETDTRSGNYAYNGTDNDGASDTIGAAINVIGSKERKVEYSLPRTLSDREVDKMELSWKTSDFRKSMETAGPLYNIS